MKKRRGNCYVSSEAAYHLLGGRDAGWKPMVVRHEGDNHWFLRHESGLLLDLTASQFHSAPPYHLARGIGFLTKKPSRRARDMMELMVWGPDGRI